MSLALDLLALQELDESIASLDTTIASLRQQLSRYEELEDARRRVEHVQQLTAAAQKKQRSLDASIADLTARIEPEEKRLFSGRVTNSKELVSIQHEVDVLKKQRSAFEDQLLDVMGRLEELDKRRTQVQANLAAVEKRSREGHAALERDLQRLEEERAGVAERRDAHAAGIAAASLRLYEAVRKRRGAGVAHIGGSACGGCRVALPDAVRRHAMSRDSLVQCPNCEKILVPGSS